MKKIFIVSIIAMLAVSCQVTEMEKQNGEGVLRLGVDLSDVMTKAGEDLSANALVNIYMADFSGLVRSFKYSEAPSEIYLAEGEYRVDVKAGEAVKDTPAKASWTSKSYFGSKAFTIQSGKDTNVTVDASVSNVVTCVSFDSQLSSIFNSGYSFAIGIDEENSLVYKTSNAGSNAYFIVDGIDEPSLQWTFSGTLTSDGSSFTKTGTIQNVEKGSLYGMNVKFTVKDGTLGIELFVDYSTVVIDDSIPFEPVSTGLSASNIYEIWAGHATVHADVDESEFDNPSDIKFSYSSNGTTWKTVAAQRASEGVYYAILTSLTPSTEYEYKLVIAGNDIGESKTLTTADATPIPNGSFEDVTSVGSYYVFYNESASDPASRTMWWGSGNGTPDVSGSAKMGIVITTPDTGVKVDGSRSVCLESQSILGMLAAGNLFCGKFMGLVGTSGGKVAFGRPWTTRPTALRFYAKYSTGTLDVIKSLPSGVSLGKSDYDRAHIQVALGTWDYHKYGGSKDSPVLVDTTDPSTFVDYATDASTIAEGDYVIMGNSSNSTNAWVQITVPLTYKNETEFPTHVIISCAASYYGDYFTGCSSSKLWLDKMEFLYE